MDGSDATAECERGLVCSHPFPGLWRWQWATTASLFEHCPLDSVRLIECDVLVHIISISYPFSWEPTDERSQVGRRSALGSQSQLLRYFWNLSSRAEFREVPRSSAERSVPDLDISREVGYALNQEFEQWRVGSHP
jgi:hypothetical protein